MTTSTVLIIESSDWEREQLRVLFRGLERPIQVLDAPAPDMASPRVDLIVLGFSDRVSLETARGQLAAARVASPMAQLVVCAPREIDGLDQRILELKARAFVLKPIEEPTFVTLINETLTAISRRRQREAHVRSSAPAVPLNNVVGNSAEIHNIMSLLERVATSTHTSVLFLGESGVGKSLFARALHDRCDRAEGPFIELNCAALPPQLLESELFGYEPGAFTDARTQKAGLIELADGGTLFLDEITEIEPVTQAKLLKFLDSKRLRRLGGEREITVETRVVAASNRDIRAEVRAGNFREDLYYRLNVVEVTIPPLRDRRADVELLTAHYLDHYRRKFGKTRLILSPETMEIIASYSWPGNVRELINAIERAVLMCGGPAVLPEHLPVSPTRVAPREIDVNTHDTRIRFSLPDAGLTLDQVEKALIESTLARTRGNVSRAASMLGVSRGALRNKITRHRIDAQRYHRPVLVPA